MLEQYIVESQGKLNWVIDGIIKGVEKGNIAYDNASNLLLKMLVNIGK